MKLEIFNRLLGKTPERVCSQGYPIHVDTFPNPSGKWAAQIITVDGKVITAYEYKEADAVSSVLVDHMIEWCSENGCLQDIEKCPYKR